jgi:uracil-DNA glycosylase
MDFSLSEVDASWRSFFEPHLDQIDSILGNLEEDVTPARGAIFRAFTYPLEDIRVLIIGQDPYPGDSVADGLAFSSQAEKIPASLRNIFKEYESDLGLPAPASPDLSSWAENGVALLNRTLTTSVGERNAHRDSRWREFTFLVAQELAEREVVAILWGNDARELSHLFRYCIESVHPSPLSARKGFFGSKPFSRANELLKSSGRQPIDWRI